MANTLMKFRPKQTKLIGTGTVSAPVPLPKEAYPARPHQLESTEYGKAWVEGADWAGLAQSLSWDSKDDFGKKAEGGPFTVRVRAGTGVKFGRFIGGDPFSFGGLDSMAAEALCEIE